MLTRARLPLAHVPTRIEHFMRLEEDLHMDVWVKRDDTTGGVEGGNKVRKLEFLLADAIGEGATTIITCGALQSNHARATVAMAARFDLRSIVFLRTTEPPDVARAAPGNAFLMRLFGADVRFVTPAEYADRTAVMAAATAELRAQGERPYVIPEGGSNGLGSLGYVAAMAEVRQQLDAGAAGGGKFDVIVHACGSGGTAAGVAVGAALYGIADAVRPYAVCDDSAYFTAKIAQIVAEMRALEPSLPDAAKVVVDDSAKGPRYGVASDEQRRFVIGVARRHGLALDPVYTGKALFGLAHTPSLARARVLFLHTGGLPGLLAEHDAFANDLAL